MLCLRTASTTVLTERLKNLMYALLPPAFWLGVWQFAAFWVDHWVDGHGNELLLPYPASVGAALVRLCGSSVFWVTAATSLIRILTGMVLGTAAGSLLAGLTCSSRWADRLISPAIRVIRATPVVSFILLVLLWTDRNMVPAIVAGLMVLPVVWGSLSRGIRETDPKLLELARAYRFSRWKTLRLIYLPSLKPYFLSAATTAMGLSWKSGVAAEVLCLPKLAVGTQIHNNKIMLEIPDFFAWTAVVVALSLCLEHLLRWLLAHWKGGVSG